MGGGRRVNLREIDYNGSSHTCYAPPCQVAASVRIPFACLPTRRAFDNPPGGAVVGASSSKQRQQAASSSMAAAQDPGCPDYPRFVRGRDSVLAYFNRLFRERIVIYDGVSACVGAWACCCGGGGLCVVLMAGVMGRSIEGRGLVG